VKATRVAVLLVAAGALLASQGCSRGRGAAAVAAGAAAAPAPPSAITDAASLAALDSSQQHAATDASTASPSAASTTDAGITDTSAHPRANPAPDAGGMLGAARCATAGVALCDDFEDAALGATPDPSKWRVLTSYSGQPSQQNHVAIDGMHVARGARALHVHTETGDPVYLETVQLPATDNGFYGRVLAYFAADPGARTKGHWGAFVGVGKKVGTSQDIEVRIGGQFDILVVNYAPTDALQLSSSRDGFYDDGAKLPVGTWTCLEFQFAGATNELRVWMDGAELERLHVTDWNQFGHGLVANWSPSYDRLRIGYQSWNADTPIDVWYDAVAVDSKRIGCER
jgi:hypothetical protein